MCNREDDARVLARHGFVKSIILTPCKEVGRHLYEYLRNKKHMKHLKRKGYCLDSDIRRIEEINQEHEIEEAKREWKDRFELMEDYRKTMQPIIEPDDDDLATHKRLRCSLWY
jgi:DNA topoisomerase VI subunit B